MKFKNFEDGFRFELANREFARISMSLIAARAAERELGPFFAGYARLEDFNAPRYHAAAERMGIKFKANAATRARGWLTGHTPLPLLRELLRIAYPRTVEYTEDLRRLSTAGPATEQTFLGYLVRQEELQVRMMHAALIGKPAKVGTMVDEFIASES